MTNRLMCLVVRALGLALLVSINGLAQDRFTIVKEIEALREQLKQKENEFLAPAAEDRARFAEPLRQPDMGLARLMPREQYREKLTVREGGAYYSFTSLSNSYDSDSQIGFEQGTLRTGFAGANFGFLVELGDIPIEKVDLDHPAVRYLAEFVAPTAEPDAREQQRKTSNGFKIADRTYRSSQTASVGRTYVLRSVSYDSSDVLVAFCVVRQDTDGSLILLWKKLKEFSTPHLARQ
ncbi:MAG TPA: hypothetical protein VK747_08025 [Blastocatellia bacterium]|nr:hypothetical protein [Blastocatellia bacterium]